MRRRNGYFIADAVIGIAIVAVLSVSLIGVLGRRRQAAQKLSDLREATRAAEAAMTDLQAGRPPRASASGSTLRITPSPVAAGSATAAATGDRVWVDVEATVGGQRATLTGLAPAGSSTPPTPVEAP
jgi:type II secretory pathway pseudopilin PulG